jgi:hypothetical protein
MVSLRRRLPRILRGPEPAAGTPAASSPTPSEEATVPRWLRPSIRAARVASLNNPTFRDPRAPVSFAAPVDEASERLIIRYDLVQLLDRPDEALGMPLGELDTGDEVEVLERVTIWARVRTPAHRDGWVPAMTLASADVLTPEADGEPAVEEIHGAAREADLPALEDLLAIAAERRALMDAQPPAAPAPPRKASKSKQSARPQKSRKTNRRTSTRKKRH